MTSAGDTVTWEYLLLEGYAPMLIETFLPALIVFLLVIAGMAVGVIFSNRRITGSCGGLSAIPGADRCGVCGRDLREASEQGCERRV